MTRDDLPVMRNLAGVSELSDEDVEKVAGGLIPTPGLSGSWGPQAAMAAIA